MAVGNADLLKNIGAMIHKISASVACTSKQGEAPVFKRKSNEEQYKTNAQVMAKIEASLSVIHSSPEQAKTSLVESIVYTQF